MFSSYPLGFPFWKTVAQYGVPIEFIVNVERDDEAGVYFATSEKIGLAVEAETLDALEHEINSAVAELMPLICPPVTRPQASWRYRNRGFAAA